MGDVKILNPDGWSVIGNLVPKECSAPVTEDVFDAHNCTLTLEDVVIIDGHPLIPVKVTPSW